MKTFRPSLLIASLAAVLASGCVHVREQVDPDAGEAPRVIVERYPQAYEVLTPHGEWIYVHGVGHVWRPYSHVVGPDFYPYATGGRWAYSDRGWIFVSDWSWGHVPFHYGRWFLARGYGWVWLPGSVWAPSWVHWRYGGGYVGWVPMAPPGYYVGGYSSWCFVDRHRFGHGHVARYREIDPAKARRAYHEATPVGGGRRGGGPSPKWFADASTPPPVVDAKGGLKQAFDGGRYVGPPASNDRKRGAGESAPPASSGDWNAGAKGARDWSTPDPGGGSWGGDKGPSSNPDKGSVKGNNYRSEARPWESGAKGWSRGEDPKASADWSGDVYVPQKGPAATRPAGAEGPRYRPAPAKASQVRRSPPPSKAARAAPAREPASPPKSSSNSKAGGNAKGAR